uniref:Uncharacterized protein n=1 Tax=Leersia perrieri TaxID=77586 RepID=A0A0D9XN82_9ORYZ
MAMAAAGDGDDHLLSLFASSLSHRRHAQPTFFLLLCKPLAFCFLQPLHSSAPHRFGDTELRLLDAALSAGADVSALLHTRSSARQLLRQSAAQAFSVPAPDLCTRLSIADFFARAFALTGDVEKDKITDISRLQNLAKSLSAMCSVQTQSAEYMKRKASGVDEKGNLHSVKSKLPGSSMFRLGIKARNIQKLRHSQERNLEDLEL